MLPPLTLACLHAESHAAGDAVRALAMRERITQPLVKHAPGHTAGTNTTGAATMQAAPAKHSARSSTSSSSSSSGSSGRRLHADTEMFHTSQQELHVHDHGHASAGNSWASTSAFRHAHTRGMQGPAPGPPSLALNPTTDKNAAGLLDLLEQDLYGSVYPSGASSNSRQGAHSSSKRRAGAAAGRSSGKDSSKLQARQLDGARETQAAPELEVVGYLTSPDCNITLGLESGSVHLERYYKKTMRYAGLLSTVTVLQVMYAHGCTGLLLALLVVVLE